MDLIEVPERVGRRHPWELARGDFFMRVFDLVRNEAGPTSWLDVGAGDAWLADRLCRSCPLEDRIVCWDKNYRRDEVGTTRVGLDLTADRPSGSFDVILMLDVIEHVEDDRDFVLDVLESFLAPGGRVVVSVPAYMALFTRHDRHLRHFRRYSPKQGRQLLNEVGLTVEVDGGLFHALLPVRAAQAAMERLRPPRSGTMGIGTWNGGATATAVIRCALLGDAKMGLALASRGFCLPGLSYWAVCRRGR